ncbi:hypothetical protein F4778DRAFT_729907 [Xylariomycetidae sp. FL2044]|nr:hypothetical protein F4778DRAFT_729907 [Xylariomycetidae sp. FL2044]
MRPKSAGYGVCEQALQVLLQSNGYFDCSEWTDGQQQYRWGKVWSWSNGCSVWVMATGGKDQTTRIGNGDIYAWIKKTMDEHREGDWIGARGNMDCGGNSIKWEINSVQ